MLETFLITIMSLGIALYLQAGRLAREIRRAREVEGRHDRL